MDNLTICTDVHKLDVDLIHQFISNSYWGKNRSLEQTQKAIHNSLNFGLYLNNNQIGYARVISDCSIFAYLMDVFIIEAHRGKKYSKKLMDHILNHPELKDVQNWKLSTDDAHGLYEQYGFEKITNPDNLMVLRKKQFI
ncbi:GNAT family N-acetyltransferase [Winogradskyella sp. 3972H.M.0a.05]|uniref:GNAT family N-acetyltransferase n=1 Tax=Winogradskyella sp. 3972H.M.0a.05 TaxID=2950277 RepID=UPI0033926454